MFVYFSSADINVKAPINLLHNNQYQLKTSQPLNENAIDRIATAISR
jgi:hypothetical protein